MSDCEHDERFLLWEDHRQPIRCAYCEIERLQQELAAARAANDRWQQLSDSLDALLACYRCHTRPSEHLLNKIAQLRTELATPAT